MHTDILRLDLRLRRRMLVGTALCAAAYLFLIVAVYPSFKSDNSLEAMISANPAIAAAFGINGSITSPSGWLGANMYSNIGPLLALLLSIGYGCAAIAGQNAEGLLGSTAVLPVRRFAILLQKTGTLLLVALVVPIASLVACLFGPQFDLNPNWGAILGVTVGLSLLAFDLGAIALLVGALSGSRGAGMGIAAGVSAAAYLISSLSTSISALHAIRWLSPFYWAVGNNQLAHGPSLGEVAALIGLGLVLFAASVPAFRRLDIN